LDGIPAGGVSKKGEIRIILDAQPDGPTDLAFTTNGRKLRDFVLDDDPSSSTRSEASFTNLDTGAQQVYRVQAGSLPAGMQLVAINCISYPNGGTGTNNNTINVQGRFAEITLEARESVTCTFVIATVATPV
jgi:hypothetical protein